MSSTNAYAVLGVPPNSSFEEVTLAYRRLARLHHPDRNPGDPQAAARFTQVRQAYEQLRSGQSRPQDVVFDFEDLLSAIFGHRPRPPQVLIVDLSPISLEQAFQGGRVSFEAAYNAPCPNPQCASRPQPGCPRCAGSGLAVVLLDCHADFEPGARDGQEVPAIVARAEPSDIPKPAVLMARLHVAPHAVWRPKGADLHASVRIPPQHLVLGKMVTLPGLGGGPVQFDIPPNTAPGARLRLPGLGMPQIGPHRADAWIEILLDWPQSWTPAQLQAWQKLADLPSS